jgi:hypothetical protein
MSEASEAQLAKWVEGEPEHNHVDNECCPDFSCCKPEFLAPERERLAFAAAEPGGKIRMEMLGGFLGRAIASHTSAKVHIAGGPYTEEQ